MSSRFPQTNLTHECLLRIRSYIAEHELRPGDRLPSLQMWSKELGVSMVVVREAFTTLRGLGLVEIHQGRGVFFRGLEDTNLIDILGFTHSLDGFTQQEIIEARAMLELTTLELCIARATPADIEELESLLPRIGCADPRDSGEHSVHKLFHQTMLRIAGNRFLEGIGMPLLNTYWILGNSGALRPVGLTAQEMQEDHSLYVQAMREHDSSHSRELVDHHLLHLCSEHHIFPFAAPSPGLSAALGGLEPVPARDYAP